MKRPAGLGRGARAQAARGAQPQASTERVWTEGEAFNPAHRTVGLCVEQRRAEC